MASSTSIKDMLELKISTFLRVYEGIGKVLERRAQR